MTIQFSLSLPADRSRSVASASLAILALRATGSLSSSSFTAFAASAYAGVRLRKNTGVPRHLTVSDMAGVSDDTSTSIEEAANVDAAGRIWSMKGHARPAAPTTAAVPVATQRTSQRF